MVINLVEGEISVENRSRNQSRDQLRGLYLISSASRPCEQLPFHAKIFIHLIEFFHLNCGQLGSMPGKRLHDVCRRASMNERNAGAKEVIMFSRFCQRKVN